VKRPAAARPAVGRSAGHTQLDLRPLSRACCGRRPCHRGRDPPAIDCATPSRRPRACSSAPGLPARRRAPSPSRRRARPRQQPGASVPPCWRALSTPRRHGGGQTPGAGPQQHGRRGGEVARRPREQRRRSDLAARQPPPPPPTSRRSAASCSAASAASAVGRAAREPARAPAARRRAPSGTAARARRSRPAAAPPRRTPSPPGGPAARRSRPRQPSRSSSTTLLTVVCDGALPRSTSAAVPTAPPASAPPTQPAQIAQAMTGCGGPAHGQRGRALLDVGSDEHEHRRQQRGDGQAEVGDRQRPAPAARRGVQPGRGARSTAPSPPRTARPSAGRR
jgi:hypothetical protein